MRSHHVLMTCVSNSTKLSVHAICWPMSALIDTLAKRRIILMRISSTLVCCCRLAVSLCRLSSDNSSDNYIQAHVAVSCQKYYKYYERKDYKNTQKLLSFLAVIGKEQFSLLHSLCSCCNYVIRAFVSRNHFLRATASMLSAHMLSQFRLSVRLSVCPSHG